MLAFDEGLNRWRAEQEVLTVGGRPFLQVTVKGPRQLKRAARQFVRSGVRTVIPQASGAPDEERLRPYGLSAVNPTPFCRANAHHLALAALKRRGKRSEACIVALRGDQVTAEIRHAAVVLCPQVKGIALTVRQGGEALAEALYAECGMGVLQEKPGVHLDAALVFSPVPERDGGDAFLLYGAVPELRGARFSLPGLSLPPGYDELRMLAALWESGGVSGENLAVEWA